MVICSFIDEYTIDQYQLMISVSSVIATLLPGLHTCALPVACEWRCWTCRLWAKGRDERLVRFCCHVSSIKTVLASLGFGHLHCEAVRVGTRVREWSSLAGVRTNTAGISGGNILLTVCSVSQRIHSGPELCPNQVERLFLRPHQIHCERAVNGVS